jgi:hypothetical protein
MPGCLEAGCLEAGGLDARGLDARGLEADLRLVHRRDRFALDGRSPADSHIVEDEGGESYGADDAACSDQVAQVISTYERR